MTSPSPTDPSPGPSPALGTGLVFAMAAAAGVAVANIYYNQPMLALIGRDLPGPATAFVPTATQFGYALGLFALVPLGDIVERRRFIGLTFACLAVALCLAALAPNSAMLVLASLGVGLTATVAQQIVPFAALLSSPEKRGATVGFVLSGILTGILLSRTLAGFVATHFGWREMFWLSAPLALAAGLGMRKALPRAWPSSHLSYGALLRSLVALWRAFPALRLAAMTQALVFAAFTSFWTILAYFLADRFGYGADVAGLFGVIGTVGILAAPLSGRIADRTGPGPVVLIGAGLTLLGWLIFGAWSTIPGLVLGVVVIDFAMQATLVANQSIVFALQPEARSRLNTILVGSMFLGGAAGSAASTEAWRLGGWPGVVGLGIAFGAAALACQLVARRPRRA